jgi:hypothetical protein
MTTIVKGEWFGGCTTDQEAQLIANYMAVTPDYFAEVSCEGDRLFGVVTVCPRETCEETCETVLNACARKTLWQYLYMVQQELEATLHWTLDKRYITETLPWDGKNPLQLTMGGLDELMVVETYERLDENLAYNPYVDHVTALATAGTHTEVEINTEYINRPEGVMLIDANGSALSWVNMQQVPGYPRIRDVLGVPHWVLAIPGQDANPGDEFDVLDCEWGYVDISTVEDCTTEGDEWSLVYDDTVQKIPIVKETTDRYYIYHRNMVRQEYQGDTIDLTQLELHKLVTTVDVGCFGEACELVTIRRQCKSTDTDCECDTVPCNVVEADGCATILNAKAGIIRIDEVIVETESTGRECPTYRQKTDCDLTQGSIFEVTVSYKTDPASAGIDMTSAVETLRRAIVSRVAAEVPLVNCGCEVECGFFKEMRHEADVTTFTRGGTTVVALRFGNKTGQKVYAKALEAVPRNQLIGIA